jgi:8-oxo-dGTP pyrophosphatase MutT (NUDIX family)
VHWIKSLKLQLQDSHVEPQDETHKVSSVLLCLGRLESAWYIVLTKRTQLVQTHKGQISLPGGIQELHDATLLHTALRESEEEIGIKPDNVEVLGILPPVDTIGRVRIYPWVALLELPFAFRLSPREVEKVLLLPVDELLSRGLTNVKVRVENYDVQSEGIYCEQELVWGATAQILKFFRDKVLQIEAESRKQNESA